MVEVAVPVDVAWRTENLGNLLFRARDRCVRDKLAALHAAGFGTMTDAQLTLFHHLDAGGARPTEIAALAGLVKSSVSELIDRAVAMELVERHVDQNDGRAIRVGYTAAGLAFLGVLETAITAADDAFAGAVGTGATRRTLAALARYADPPAPADSWDNVGRWLGHAAKRFVGEVLGAAHDAGHGTIGKPLLTLFRTLEIGGSRLTDVAARGGVTKQAMRETVAVAVRRHLVATHVDPDDRRVQYIAFTASGLATLERLRLMVADAERGAATLLGDAALADLRDQLTNYLAGAQAKLRPTNQ